MEPGENILKQVDKKVMDKKKIHEKDTSSLWLLTLKCSGYSGIFTLLTTQRR